MPTQFIGHVTSRCGGGKSFHIVAQLHNHLVKTKARGQEPDFFILASKTNHLSQQNYEHFVDECKKSQSSVSCKLIDSSNGSSSVVADISDHLRNHKEGVLFISHAAVAIIDPSLLSKTTLIFDEVPDNLVKEIRLFHEAKDKGQPWEKFISYLPKGDSALCRVTLNPNIDRGEVQRYITNILTRKDNVTTADVAEMLQFLLDDHEDLYFMPKQQKDATIHYYTGIDWRRLDALRRCASSIVILSAELKRTLLGFVAKNVAGLDIQEITITPDIQLHTEHKKHAIIYPILKDRTWSTFIKGKRATEFLKNELLSILPHETVFDHALRIVSSKLGNSKYLLIMNKKDEAKNAPEQENIKIISSSSHGSNSYMGTHHAAYLASKRPDPVEKISLNLFASKYNLDHEELNESVITERCYESAYQCIARTSVRDFNSSFEGPHIFFVPDMKYAEYVLEWFEPGYAKIDTSRSCTNQSTKAKQDKTQQGIELLASILAANKSQKKSIKDLVKQAGISIPTYNRLRAKHKVEMQQRGLMQ